MKQLKTQLSSMQCSASVCLFNDITASPKPWIFNYSGTKGPFSV